MAGRSRRAGTGAAGGGAIVVACRYSPAPGQDWFVRLECGPRGRGARVVFESGSSTSGEVASETFELPQPPSWRGVARLLLGDEEFCVFGDQFELFDCIEVEGVEEWMEVPLKLAMVRDETGQPWYRSTVELFMRADDETAAAMASRRLTEFAVDELR